MIKDSLDTKNFLEIISTTTKQQCINLMYLCLILRKVLSWWCGGVVVIRSPCDREVPSLNPGKNSTSDFSIIDPFSIPSCDLKSVVSSRISVLIIKYFACSAIYLIEFLHYT